MMQSNGWRTARSVRAHCRAKMRRVEHWISAEDEKTGADRQTASLAALAVVLVLIIVSLMLVRTLRAEASLEDCLLSGRIGCTAIVTKS